MEEMIWYLSILSFIVMIAGAILIGLAEYGKGKIEKNDIPKLDYLGKSRLIKTNFKPHWWYDEND